LRLEILIFALFVTGDMSLAAKGRSRTRFDDMVRLDLRYSQSWSVWLESQDFPANSRSRSEQ
jgi:hypothetical protein